MKNVIRIYGDSISNPRYIDDIPAEDIWSELLKDLLEEKFQHKFCLFNKARGGMTIDKQKEVLDNDFGYFKGNSGIVIIHIGIVDCSPRPISKNMRRVVSILPEPIKQKVILFLHDHRSAMQRFMIHRFTTPKKFKKIYNKMLEKLTENSVFCIGIGPVSQRMIDRSFGLDGSIAMYNEIIKECVSKHDNCYYVDTEKHFRERMSGDNTSEDDIFLKDGHHYTKLGHKYFSSIMFKEICEISG